MMAKPSLKTVAEACGYGVSTVSYVLRGKAAEMNIPERTQDRILATAKELGYRRNRIGAALSTGKTGFVALISGAYGHPWRESRQALAATQLTDLGYHVHQFDTHWDAGSPGRMVGEVLSLRPDGILVSDVTDSTRTEILDRIAESGIPTVGLDYLEDDRFGYVYLDRVAAGRLPTEHLLELGHRELSFVMPTSRARGQSFYLTQRLEGFHQALAAAGIAPAPEQLLWHETGPSLSLLEAGYGSYEQLQAAQRSALIFTNDLMVLGFMKACHERGVSIPENLSVVGSEDLAVCRYLPVPPTTLSFPIAAMVERAVAMLRAALDGEATAQVREGFAPTLIVRDSTCPIH